MEQWEYMAKVLDFVEKKLFAGDNAKKVDCYGVREQNSTVQKSPELAAQTVPENASFLGSIPNPAPDTKDTSK